MEASPRHLIVVLVEPHAKRSGIHAPKERAEAAKLIFDKQAGGDGPVPAGKALGLLAKHVPEERNHARSHETAREDREDHHA